MKTAWKRWFMTASSVMWPVGLQRKSQICWMSCGWSAAPKSCPCIKTASMWRTAPIIWTAHSVRKRISAGTVCPFLTIQKLRSQWHGCIFCLSFWSQRTFWLYRNLWDTALFPPPKARRCFFWLAKAARAKAALVLSFVRCWAATWTQAVSQRWRQAPSLVPIWSMSLWCWTMIWSWKPCPRPITSRQSSPQNCRWIWRKRDSRATRAICMCALSAWATASYNLSMTTAWAFSADRLSFPPKKKTRTGMTIRILRKRCAPKRKAFSCGHLRACIAWLPTITSLHLASRRRTTWRLRYRTATTLSIF